MVGQMAKDLGQVPGMLADLDDLEHQRRKIIFGPGDSLGHRIAAGDGVVDHGELRFQDRRRVRDFALGDARTSMPLAMRDRQAARKLARIAQPDPRRKELGHGAYASVPDRGVPRV